MSPMPAAPAAPRTFAGDPNPPAQAPDAPKVAPAAAPESSAGTGELPPEAQAGAPGRPAQAANRTYSVVERADGSRDVFASDKNGDVRMGAVNVPDADQVLHASAHYDDKMKTWDNVPEETAKSLLAGRLGFPERVAAAWSGGEAGVVRSLIGAKLMSGEMSVDAAREQGNHELLKTRLDSDPAVAWQGGFGKTVAAWVKHPLAAAEEGVVGAVGMAPMMKDILLHGTAAGGAKGAAVGAGAALLTGPAAVADALPLMSAGLEVGAKLGTAERAYKIFGGQFAMDMADKGYDQPTIQKYAPMVGVVNALLTSAQLELMTPSMQQKIIQGIAGSDTVKSAIAGALFKFAGRTAGFTALTDAQTAVNDYVGNMAAVAAKRPDLLTSGADAKAHLLQTTLSSMLTGGVMAGATGLAEGLAPTPRSPERPGEPAPVLSPDAAPPASAAGPETAAPAEGARQNPPATSEGGSTQLPGQAEKGPSNLSVADKAEFDKVLKYRALEGEKTPAETVTRMKGEVAAMRELIGGDNTPIGEKGSEPMPNARFIEAALGRHETDIATLEKGTEAESKPREFFKNPEIDVKPLENDKATAEDIRHQFVGQRDEQVARINQLTRQYKREVPDLLQRQAVTRYLDVGGDREALEAAASNPDLSKESRAQYAAALDLSPKAAKWAETLGRFYGEAADVGQEKGTLRQARENYINRLYEPEKSQDFVKAELSQNVRRSTSHALQRSYDTMELAEMDGRKFATTDSAELASVYNEEVAHANAGRAMADSMTESGLGAWKSQRSVPEGWAQVGNIEKSTPIRGQDGKAVIGDDGNQAVSHSVFVAPEGIAKGLAAIAEPNYAKKIEALRGIQRYQGLVKTVDLSFSLFHHLSMLAQLAYNGDFSDMMKVKGIDNFLDAPEFGEREQFAVRHELTTAITGDNADILRRLTEENGDTFSKIVNAPGVKQVLETTDKSADYLFGKVARLWKVNTFSKLAADWAGGHPDATNAEVTAAMRGFARHVNDRFGGQNWEAMGMTKSNMSLLRIGLLAPDWTISNMHMLKAAIGEGGTSGSASRVHVLSSLMVGMAATEGLNKVLTGHFTDENKPGHKLEVEIAPDVYVSLLRGAVSDITKLASMVAESGLGGVSRFAQGKLAPFARTGVGLLTNTEYNGRSIVPKHAGPVAGTYDVLKYALGSLTPVPLGISNLASYAKSDEPTVGGAVAVATGVGRYSQPPKRR